MSILLNWLYFFIFHLHFSLLFFIFINKLGHCPTRSDNAHFANNEQASLAVFTAAFCFQLQHPWFYTCRTYNLIKLKLYNN